MSFWFVGFVIPTYSSRNVGMEEPERQQERGVRMIKGEGIESAVS
jgi:hypothetical protein